MKIEPSPICRPAKRLDLIATVYEGTGRPARWVVEAIGDEGGGDVYMAFFTGQNAREAAEEYALAKHLDCRKR